jgi:hypothetical protein
MKFDAQGRLVSPAGTPAMIGAGAVGGEEDDDLPEEDDEDEEELGPAVE